MVVCLYSSQAVKLDQALANYFGDPQEFIDEGKCKCKKKVNIKT